MRQEILSLVAATGLVVPVAAQDAERAFPDPVPGTWNAWIDAQGRRIPFGLELERTGDGGWRARIRNADERIELAGVGWRGDRFELPLAPYDATLWAYVVNEGRRLKGMWVRRRGPEHTLELPFGAVAGELERFPLHLREPLGTARGHIGRWGVRFEQSDEPAVGVFDLLPDGRTRGTFLTTVGDHRFLEGAFDGRNLLLSCFDGAHAFLYEASLQPDGTLAGTFWSGSTWQEGWTARPDPEAELPDPLGLTSWTGAGLGELRFPDLDGRPRALDDPAFAGRARLIVLFGSWCPNCHDETRYLVELHRRYRERGLSILGLAFEFGDDPEHRARVVREYARHLGIDYPLLVAGPADKAAASEAFPLLDRVHAWPTTIFLDGSGGVRGVYTGFSGPATGEAHERLRERFEGLVEGLLGSD